MSVFVRLLGLYALITKNMVLNGTIFILVIYIVIVINAWKFLVWIQQVLHKKNN